MVIKKSVLVIIALSLFVNVFADNRDKEDVQKIIKQGVNIINHLNKVSMDDFCSYCIDSSDIEMVIADELDPVDTLMQEQVRHSLLHAIDDVADDYADLLKQGVEYNINWSEVNFKYAVYYKERGFKSAGIAGIIFESDQALYSIEFKVVKVNGVYKFVQIESLQKEYKKKDFQIQKYRQMSDDIGYFFDYL